MTQLWSERRVEGIGPAPAKVMIISEAPGEQEDKQGIPFCGLAGQVLDGMLAEVGIDRESIYITNIAKHRPKDNDFSLFDTGYLTQALDEVRAEILQVRPNIIVLAGAIPLWHILEKRDITKYRGSVLESKYGKCIPIIHPAAITRDWKWRPITICDIAKVKREAEFSEIRREERHFILMPHYELVLEFLNTIKTQKAKVSFDVETETGQITCIALAASSYYAISIPFWFGASGSFFSEEQELEIWRRLKDILEDESIPKIAQNAQYDMTILRDKYDIRVKGLWLDTMIGFHALYPELPKNLALMTSLYTDIPYYKYMIKSDDMTEFFRYNALDAMATYECAEKIYAEMAAEGVERFYREHMHSLIEPIMAMNEKGIRIDDDLRKKAIKELKGEIAELQQTLQDRVGYDININSPKQMQKWLYSELKLPVQYQRRKSGEGLTKTPSADEESLMALYSLTRNEALKIVIDIRERMKLVSTYLEVQYDKEKDGSHCARTSLNIAGTETGRLSSSETVYGTGTCLQNVPKGICRRMFIPDEGKVFVNADLCVAPQTRILKADMSWTRASELKPGDKLVGFDEDLRRSVCHYKTTEVLANEPLSRPCIRVITDKGDVVCSEEHGWVARKPKHSRRWCKAKDLRPGDRLHFIGHAWEPEHTYNAGWLAGLFDGEGHFCDTAIGFTQVEGKGVWEKGLAELTTRGFEYTVDRNSVGIPRANLYGKLNTWRFLGQIRPSRLLKKAALLYEGRAISGRREQSATVLRIDKVTSSVVYPVSTESKTFIAEGFLSHNSQAEARVVAYLAQDERLIKLFDNGGDIHRRNAANIFGKTEGEVTESERELAKRITHASNYKIGPVTFAKEAGLSIPESKRILNQYYANYPRIKIWHLQVESQLRKSRTMTTPMGRKRTFFNRWSEQLVKEGVAYLPQSTVVDIVNDALRDMYSIFSGTKTDILLQIHDAILLQTPIKDIARTVDIVKSCMQRAVVINNKRLIIPCDISIGENWNDMRRVA